MIHYHGTPISPRSVLQALPGRHFCVSFASPRDVTECHKIGQGVMLDNGAYSLWRRNTHVQGYIWDGYYSWLRPWLDFQTTWCVIPDVIGGSEHENDLLIGKWFTLIGSYRQAAPVWHLHESFGRLDRLVRGFDKVCIGSSGEYSLVGSDRWNNRVNEAFNRICKGSGSPPCWLHMLRGMSLSGSIYPFASVDSTDIAQNHNRNCNGDAGCKARQAVRMANQWDAMQCPGRWEALPIQMALKD